MSTSEEGYDDFVLFIIDQITGQYGTNDNSPSFIDSLPGYPIFFVGLFMIGSIVFVIKKRFNKLL